VLEDQDAFPNVKLRLCAREENKFRSEKLF
jgi:hypothetical protein